MCGLAARGRVGYYLLYHSLLGSAKKKRKTHCHFSLFDSSGVSRWFELPSRRIPYISRLSAPHVVSYPDSLSSPDFCCGRGSKLSEMGDEGAENGSSSRTDNTVTTESVPKYSILREGEADILLHGNDVFYNKAQVVNRDISIAVIRAFIAKREEEHKADVVKKLSRRKGPSQNPNPPESTPDAPVISSVEAGGEEVSEPAASAGPKTNANGSDEPAVEASAAKPVRILEALAASGLRALRYAKEIEGVGSVIATDNDKVAVEACQRNIKLNGPAAAAKVEPKLADARVYMLTHEKEFDVVDLDPYGSPSVFLDSAVQTIADGGLLLCTATDMAVLCGNNGEVCYSKYGSYPLRGKYCHEMALRILLACIESHANRYKRYIVPLISLSVDFYVRVFVRVYTSANIIKSTPSKLTHIYQCVGCDSYHFQPVGRIAYKNNSPRYMPANGPSILPECKQCKKHFNMGGPMWAAPIHDAEWISTTLNLATSMKARYPAFDKLHSILTAVSEELLDIPLYVNLHNMSATLKCTPPAAAMFRSAVANAGYRISGSHANPLGLKTDAPMDVLWDIMRCWVKTHPVKVQAAETPGSVILSKEPEIQANFTKVNSALSKAQAKGVARFLPNPEEYWGPKPRAGRHITEKHIAALGPNVHQVAGNTHIRPDQMTSCERRMVGD
ncbi:hypothetical protein R1sor_020124 [Riccia sorocarpa]|uniref:tRNA (guanine(26)-N(2))-dimethyltransferase n=1 Tax=Riccia sorocarpa TaxID=122646 RepID=A0ABD3IIX4_9MARC